MTIRRSFGAVPSREQRISDELVAMEREIYEMEVRAGLTAPQAAWTSDSTIRSYEGVYPAWNSTLDPVSVEAPYVGAILSVFADWEGRWWTAPAQSLTANFQILMDSPGGPPGEIISVWETNNLLGVDRYDWLRLGTAANGAGATAMVPGLDTPGTAPRVAPRVWQSAEAGTYTFSLRYTINNSGGVTDFNIQNQRLFASVVA